MESQTERPKYSGYGYHGGGRKKLSESGRKSFAVSLQQEQIDFIKKLAEEKRMSYSQLILAAVNYYKENN